MTWLSNQVRWTGWLYALSLLSLPLSSPLRADDPTTLNEASEVARTLESYLALDGRVLFRHAQLDLDADGSLDLVAHVARPETAGSTRPRQADARSALVVVLGNEPTRGGAAVTVDLADGMLCPYCPIGERDQNRSLPEQTLRARDGRVELCEAWGQRWYARQCAMLRLVDGALRLERHHETSGWTRGPSEHLLELEFESVTAATGDVVETHGRRSYLTHPVEAGFPVLERSAAFAVLSAVRDTRKQPPVLDGTLDDEAWASAPARRFSEPRWVVSGQDHWSGARDLSLTWRAVWRDDALWLAIEVEDDAPVRTTCEDLDAPIQADRIELWFDLGTDQRMSGNDEALDEHRRVYLEDPMRHAPDDQVLELVLAPIEGGGACAVRHLPRGTRPAQGTAVPPRSPELDEPGDGTGDEPTDVTPASIVVGIPGEVRAAVIQNETGAGWRAEVVLPAAFFGTDDLMSFEGRRTGIGLTVLAHDVDVPDRPQDATELATSELRWGDPYTFGILVMPRHPPQLPLFPFAWADWLD